MNGTSKLRAFGLALGMVASAAGTGWALQLPLTAMVAGVGAVDMPTPDVSLPRSPQPVTQADDRAQALGTGASEGLEEMSATGAASVQQ